MHIAAVPPEEDELALVMRQTRERFVAGFPARCDEIVSGLASGMAAYLADVKQAVHKIAGLAGTVGFPDVSRIASDIEVMLGNGGAAPGRVIPHVASMREAFTRESRAPSVQQAFDRMWRPTSAGPDAVRLTASDAHAAGHRILVVDDDDDQRTLTTSILERSGYAVTALPLADTVIETAQRVAPSAILLDVMMPGINGHLACRLLKSEPEVANVPVMFVSSHAALEERMAGLALGAVDYVAKPVDSQELLFRLRRAIEQTVAAPEPTPAPDTVLSYAAFEVQARSLVAAHLCTLVLLRVDPKAQPKAAEVLVQESRRRDLVAQFDRMHLVLLLPELSASAASARLMPIVESCPAEGLEVRAGLATGLAGARTLDELIQEADEALAEARFHGSVIGQKGLAVPDRPTAAASQRVLLADDDPDVVRIVDAEMRGLHFATSLAFDGQAALAALAAERVHLIVLDLMLPKVTGFEILHQLRAVGDPRPRLIVLSARGREEDITRAFDLGADDYMTKPFRPHELGARVVRLLR